MDKDTKLGIVALSIILILFVIGVWFGITNQEQQPSENWQIEPSLNPDMFTPEEELPGYPYP